MTNIPCPKSKIVYMSPGSTFIPVLPTDRFKRQMVLCSTVFSNFVLITSVNSEFTPRMSFNPSSSTASLSVPLHRLRQCLPSPVAPCLTVSTFPLSGYS